LGRVFAMAAGDLHSLALQSNGTVVAWGDNTYGQTNVPAGLTNVMAIAGGGYHSLALQSNGTVVAWGDNIYGQTNVPVGLSNVMAITAGDLHSLALQSNGTITAWGYGNSGQTSTPPWLSNVVAIAAGGYHSLAITVGGLTNGLAAFYPFDGRANDASGNGYNGVTHFASPGTDRFGRVGGSFLFNGVTSFVDVPDSSALRLSTTDFTIVGWIFENQRNADYQNCIVSKRGTNAADGWFLGVRGQRAGSTPGVTGNLFYQVSGGSDPSAASAAVLSLSQWHYIAIVYSNSTQTLEMFIDGVRDSTTGGLPAPNANTVADMHIGNDSSNTNGTFNFHGNIDDLRIYNRALADSELLALYSSGVFLSGSRATNGLLTVNIGGLVAGQTVIFQGRTNLGTWTSIQTNSATGPTVTVTNISHTLPLQFFRAALLP